MAEPIIPRFEGVRREHGFLYLAPRRLILLQNPQRVAQLCIGPLQTLVRLHQVALQLPVMHAALNRAPDQAGFLGGVHKKTRRAQPERGGHAVHIAVVTHRQHRHLHIKVAHHATHRRPRHIQQFHVADHAVPGAVRAEDGLDIGGLGGNFVAVVRVIQRGDQCSRAVRLIIDYQHRTHLSHVSSAGSTAGDASEFFLVPVAVKLGEVVFDLSSGFQHRAALQIHIAEEDIAITGHDFLGVE